MEKCIEQAGRPLQTCCPALPISTTCKLTTQLNISSKDDWPCLATSIIELSGTQLILADKRNCCLKLFDITDNIITKRRDVTCYLWDITKVPGCRVAVSLSVAKKIQFFKADETLEPCESIDVISDCYGLHCIGDRLIVSYYRPAKLQIISLTGTVLQTIQHDPSGKDLFQFPQYLAVSNDNKLIYVSDYKSHTLTCLTITGGLQWIYRDEQLICPKGVTTGENCIYICSSSTHTIHVVSHDGVRHAIIPRSQSAVQILFAICYTGNNRTLYVSNHYVDYICRLSLQ